jgi:O-antigen/teichoic acid export membrane protein
MPAPRLSEALRRLRGEGIGAVLARGALAFLLLNVLGMALSLGVNVLLARSLGAEAYGVYVTVFNWMLVLLIAARAGLATASLRFVSSYAAREQWEELRGFLGTTRAVVAAASLAVAAATAAAVWLLGERLGEAMRLTFWVGCLALPVHAFVQVGGAVLRGFKRVIASEMPGTVFHPLLLGAGTLGLALAAPSRLDAPAAMALNLGAALGALAWVAAALRRATPEPARRAAGRRHTGEWLAVATPLLAFNALNVVIQRADVILVGALAGAADAGVYAAASRIAGLTAFGLTAVNAWAAPLIADLYARGDRPGLQRLVRIAALGIFAFTLPLSLGLIAFGREVLAWFGPEFAAAYAPLLVLVGGQLVNALVGPVGFLMTMTGRQRAATWILAAHAALDLALNALLIPRYGIAGAAVATAAARASLNLVLAGAVWQQMRLRATIV